MIEASYKAGVHGPEAFIWMVLNVLVECGLIMEKGGINEIPPEWKEIVPRDLKPQNIVLDSKIPDRWPQYPKVKLADFGLSFETSKRDKLNPLIWTGAGTRGFLPPEQCGYMDSETRDAFQSLAHTNVWGFGAILYTLMHRGGTYEADHPRYLPGMRDTYWATKEVAPPYSHSLRNEVHACMRFDPATRPSFETLRKHIDAAMAYGRAGDAACLTS